MQSNLTAVIVVENSSKVGLVWFTVPFSAVCSIGKLPFWGKIKIEYRPNTQLLEFVSTENYIKSLGNQSVTIEDVTRLVFDMVSRALGDIPLRVTVTAETTVHAPAGAQIQRGDW